MSYVPIATYILKKQKNKRQGALTFKYLINWEKERTEGEESEWNIMLY